PGRGAGNAFDLQPLLLEQAVEHAPGEGAMGAAALQGQVDLQRRTTARRRGLAPAAARGGGWATGGQGHGVDPEGGMAAWRHDHRPPALRTRAAIDALPGTCPSTGTAARLPRYRPGPARLTLSPPRARRRRRPALPRRTCAFARRP